MRIQDYSTLVQALQDFSHRPSIAPLVDYFIQGGENRIYNKIAVLNEGNGLQWMEQPLSATIDAETGYATVPEDFFSMKDANVVTGGGTFDLTMKESGWIYAKYPVRSPQGVPSYIAREGANFIFGPFPDSAYSLTGTYYGRGAPLGADNETTWMVQQIPEVLLAAAMRELCMYLKDQQSADFWDKTALDKLNDVCLADKAQRYAGGTLVINTGVPSIMGGP